MGGIFINKFNGKWLRENYDDKDDIYLKKLMDYIKKYYKINENSLELAKNYLTNRNNQMKNKDTFGIVYDITYKCNLSCLHCGVNAEFLSPSTKKLNFEKKFDDIISLIDKIHEYFHENGLKRYFLMIGGGEPFIRPDFKDIMKYASHKLGPENLGINTNGTICKLNDLIEIHDYVDTIEISLDGFKRYHNEWRRSSEDSINTNPFDKTLELIKEIIENKSLKSKLEISSMVTKDNINDLHDFIKFISETGVTNYSIHRPMPIGRMSKQINKIPSPADYFQMMITISKLINDSAIKMENLHIHHSLESIFSAILLGFDIHLSKNIMSSKRHSIGIDPYGNVFMDPWCVVPPYNKFSAGNLLINSKSLNEIINSEDSIISIANNITKKSYRCGQCKLPCSGGMRFNALANYISKFSNENTKISESHIIIGLSKMDPACPLYTN